MKRIKSINGYTIYQATARDAARDNVEEGYFYLYFSSDIREYGRAYSYIEYEAGSLEEAETLATGTHYAVAREYVEANTTAANNTECVQAIKKDILYYVHVFSSDYDHYHGPYFSIEAADAGAINYSGNTGAEYLPPVNN